MSSKEFHLNWIEVFHKLSKIINAVKQGYLRKFEFTTIYEAERINQLDITEYWWYWILEEKNKHLENRGLCMWNNLRIVQNIRATQLK